MSVVIACEAHEVVAVRDLLDDIQRWRAHNQNFEDPVTGAVLDVRNLVAALPIPQFQGERRLSSARLSLTCSQQDCRRTQADLTVIVAPHTASR